MLLEKLKGDLLSAQKNKDAVVVGVLRYLIAEIKNKEIELRPTGETLSELHVVEIIKKQISQRKDCIDSFAKAGRGDLVAKETAELEVLTKYS